MFRVVVVLGVVVGILSGAGMLNERCILRVSKVCWRFYVGVMFYGLAVSESLGLPWFFIYVILIYSWQTEDID